MLHDLYLKLHITSPTAMIIVSIALMMFCGFAMTRITKHLRLPAVTAYITVGILIGPYCLDLIPKQIIEGSDFLADIALAFISFCVGEFFRTSALKKNGIKVVVITLFEAIITSVIVFVLTFFILRLNFAFSIVLSALASATAPASTMMTIRQTRSKGDFVETLLQVIALDDVLSLIAYSIAISLALASMAHSGPISPWMIVKPILINIFVMFLGALFGVLMKLLMPKKRSTDNRLIISVATLFSFCAVCALLDVSPLLGCMSMGTVYINITDDDKLFKQLNYFSPPFLLLFFVRSGLNFNLSSLVTANNSSAGVSLLLVAILYFVFRVIGKYVGTYLGCFVVGKGPLVRNYLGLALMPQASVAIGLAALCARVLGEPVGGDLQTIILAASIMHELIGPACAKLSLYLSKSYSTKLEEITDAKEVDAVGKPKTQIELLLERLQEIQNKMPSFDPDFSSDEEKAFTQAAEEQFEWSLYQRNNRFINRR